MLVVVVPAAVVRGGGGVRIFRLFHASFLVFHEYNDDFQNVALFLVLFFLLRLLRARF